MTEHYFTAGEAGEPFERESFTEQIWGHQLAFETGAGVCSRGHLDQATAVLLREVACQWTLPGPGLRLWRHRHRPRSSGAVVERHRTRGQSARDHACQ